MGMSQNQQILDYLSSGKKLTSLDALNLFGCNRLAARINDLKQNGFNIESEMIDVECNHGHTARVACYSMKSWW